MVLSTEPVGNETEIISKHDYNWTRLWICAASWVLAIISLVTNLVALQKCIQNMAQCKVVFTQKRIIVLHGIAVYSIVSLFQLVSSSIAIKAFHDHINCGEHNEGDYHANTCYRKVMEEVFNEGMSFHRLIVNAQLCLTTCFELFSILKPLVSRRLRVKHMYYAIAAVWILIIPTFTANVYICTALRVQNPTKKKFLPVAAFQSIICSAFLLFQMISFGTIVHVMRSSNNYFKRPFPITWFRVRLLRAQAVPLMITLICTIVAHAMLITDSDTPVHGRNGRVELITIYASYVIWWIITIIGGCEPIWALKRHVRRRKSTILRLPIQELRVATLRDRSGQRSTGRAASQSAITTTISESSKLRDSSILSLHDYSTLMDPPQRYTKLMTPYVN